MTSKSVFILFAALFIFASCLTPETKTHEPAEQLTQEEITALTKTLIRHIAKMPDKATHESKFQSRYDSYYENESKHYEFIFYGQNPTTGTQFFTYLRPAPSIHEKYVAIGGEIRVENDEIEYLKEHFRTWKMKREKLMPKAELLFRTMINKEDLSTYYPQNSGEEEFIQFPNESNYYDTETLRWKTRDKYKSVYEAL